MLKAALVSYLNTKPFILGIEKHFSPEEMELSLMPPSACAQALKNKACDIALVPVGALNELSGVRIMKDHCIGASGTVNSVFLFSDTPVEDISLIYPDPDSRSSNLLARVLAAGWWKISPAWEDPEAEIPEHLPSGAGRVCIGDKAIKARAAYRYAYDLAAEWQRWTELPFVFAVWAYYPENVSRVMLDKFRMALEDGCRMIPEAARRWGAFFGMTEPEAEAYLAQNIQLRFDALMHEGFDRFLLESAKLAQ